MKKEKRLQHALHNERVCSLIYNTKDFSDWVITTAYYASLHFVSYSIFPMKEKTENGNKFDINSLDEYCNIKAADRGKHNVLCNLVRNKLPKIASEFRWLKDLCLSARYENYQQTERNAQKAFELLTMIKEASNI
jgi:hypothetical protein